MAEELEALAVRCEQATGPGGYRFMVLAMANWRRAAFGHASPAGTAFFMKQMSGVRKPLPPIPAHLMLREFPRSTISRKDVNNDGE